MYLLIDKLIDRDRFVCKYRFDTIVDKFHQNRQHIVDVSQLYKYPVYKCSTCTCNRTIYKGHVEKKGLLKEKEERNYFAEEKKNR